MSHTELRYHVDLCEDQRVDDPIQYGVCQRDVRRGAPGVHDSEAPHPCPQLRNGDRRLKGVCSRYQLPDTKYQLGIWVGIGGESCVRKRVIRVSESVLLLDP